MTYKEQVKLISYLIMKYNYQKMEDNFRFYCFDSDLVVIIDHVLAQLDQDSLRIIKNDFIDKNVKFWWNEYYSKTTYYRLKNKAMTQFINCLHNRKMIL